MVGQLFAVALAGKSHLKRVGLGRNAFYRTVEKQDKDAKR